MTPPPRPPGGRGRNVALYILYAVLLGARALVRWIRERPPGRKAPLFPRWANGAFFAVLGGVGGVVVAAVGALLWTAYDATPQGWVSPAQPVPFSHQIHVGSLEIDCRFCHTSAERAAPAGMPATRVCVPCHSETWLQSEPFRPVRESLALDLPIPWKRVNDVPDFAQFHHGIHSEKGIGCETCHGRVDQMSRVRQAAPLTMGWCLDCHRNPERFLRPRSEVTTMGWVPPAPQEEIGAELKAMYGVAEKTHCSACHW